MKDVKKRVCPKCHREYTQPPAISRTDNKTEICPVCGATEAIKEWLKARKGVVS